MIEPDERDIGEISAALDDEHARRHLAALRRHPDCMDPEHPGCEDCCDE